MKALYRYYPNTAEDDLVTITGNTALAGYPLTNLNNIRPGILYKTDMVGAGESAYINFQIDIAARPYNTIFLNRFNFAEFYIEKSTDGSTWVEVVHVTGQTRDEFYYPDPTGLFTPDNYMHYIYTTTTPITSEYLRLRIPYQTPLFDASYFSVGNFLFGTYVELRSPQKGFSIEHFRNMVMSEFDSGFVTEYKVGKSKRFFNGNLFNLNKTEYDKLLLTRAPFVLYLDFNLDPTQVYLVKSLRGYSRIFDNTAAENSLPFTFEELV